MVWDISVPYSVMSVVSSGHYCELMLYLIIGHVNEGDIACGCFQQDGVTLHMAHVFMALLHSLLNRTF
jgi:hypothetical protein